MCKELKNKKGFTLIELLAAIVILGVLMMVAIPAMTRYISNSKKDVYVNTAKQHINAVRYALMSDGFADCSAYSATGGENGPCGLTEVTNQEVIIVPVSLIQLDSSSGELSPWGKEYVDNSFVVIKNDATSNPTEKPVFSYSYVGVDSGSNGIETLVTEDSLARKNVKTSAKKTSRDTVVSEITKGYTGTYYIVKSLD